MNLEELPRILSQEEETELQLAMHHVRTGESQEYMLAKEYMLVIARVFVHNKID